MSPVFEPLADEPLELGTGTFLFAKQIFQPLPSGALYWPKLNTLLVADLHLEKMSSFAKRGQLLPPYDTGLTLRRLDADIELTGAKKLIALGDSFHRDAGTLTLQEQDRAHLELLTAQIEWMWLSGNHDPTPHTLGGACAPDLVVEGIRLCHEPKRGEDLQIAGHLHPAARIAINGRSQYSNCFVADDRLIILPAYGSSTGSLNILGKPFHGLLDKGHLRILMLGKERVYPVSKKFLVG
jgi:DNA ligase-associated metallophosphoesterase